MVQQVFLIFKFITYLVLAWVVLSWAGHLWSVLPFLLTLWAITNILLLSMVYQKHPALKHVYQRKWADRYLRGLCYLSKQPHPLDTSPRSNQILLKTQRDYDIAEKQAVQLVRGHDEIIKKTLSQIYENRLLHLSRRSRNGSGPLASFLLIGRTGVGKRYWMRVLSKLLYGSKGVDVFDCSKLTINSFDSSKDQVGELVDLVRDDPYRLILFENVTKTPADVVPLLVQILTTGEIKIAGSNSVVSFQNTLIALSTTEATDKMERLGAVDLPEPVCQQQISEIMKSEAAIAPTLINAVTEIYFFEPPSDLVKAEVVALLMQRKCHEHQIALSHVAPEIVATQVVQMEQESGFEFLPERIKKLLHKPLLAAVAEQPTSLALRVRPQESLSQTEMC